CGSGGYLLRMQLRGWHVRGMDMSSQAVQACQSRGLDVIEGIDPTEIFPPESFDLISMWHVIEHVPSPTQTLRQMHRLLVDGGKLMMAMPNIEATLEKKYGVYWFPYELPRHFNHFDRSSLRKILKKTGFEVEFIRGQKHGRIFQKTVQYVGREKKGGYAWLGRRKRLCSWIEYLVDRWGEPSVLMVQAHKVSSTEP
ncbi:MAG: class I SAM-dependent methyltransferase, partial [Planctomycetes bacterium]|nr:class I SAM-dependent methyltransferase [Planctomycetota bacterium]